MNGKSKAEQTLAGIPPTHRIVMSFICWCYIPRVIGVAVPAPQRKTPIENTQLRGFQCGGETVEVSALALLF